ncbi:hypothetical protein [Duganella sp. S19_KUP01_CR8]|uniref:hypothetical protein n=1 Tax=Duganella sp. S19_KUP01_CR8 TaxID=3025502 RepID=UPI002FCD80C8
MNMPIKFDTLEYARKLVEAGMSRDQASAQAQALSEALSEATVAPAELVLLRADLIARMEIQKHDTEILKRDVEILKIRVDARFTTVFWMLGISMVLHAVTIGMLLHLLARLP